jgi:integrase
VIGDGGGLWLQCTLGEGGHVRRSWTFRYELNGRRREMGLGPTHTLGLSEAREKARTLRQQLLDGIDPLEAREATHRARLAKAARTVTFQRCAELYLNLHEQGWGPKHREQWSATLRDYVYPVIGDMSVPDVDQAAVLKIIEPIWKTKTVTAARIRGRIESVLDYAAANNFRSGDNPARALLTALPKQAKTHKVEHHAALPWREIPNLMTELRRDNSVAARCIELIILTASRTSETTGATWDEIAFAEKTWAIPPERMKGRKEHRIPLSDRALEILESLPRKGRFVFGHLHNKALPRVLKRLRPDITLHGTGRSSFRDWARESTSFPDAIVEAALAHAVGNKTVAAYARGDLFEKRARLMQAWADFCAKPAPADAKVTRLRERVAT